MFLDLPHVAADRLPALDLPAVLVGHAPAHVITAIPLEPAAWIVRVNPAFARPFRKRLAGVDTKEIACTVAAARREPSTCEPTLWKFAAAVGHVFAAEHAELEHLRGCQLRPELGIEV